MKKIFPVSLLIIFLISCGYKLTQKRLSKPVKIYVYYFKNNTNETRVEDFLTQYLKDEIILHEDTILVSNLKKADLFLKGNIEEFKYTGVSYLSSERVLEYRIWAKVRVNLIDKFGNVLKSKDFLENKEFRTGITEYNLKNVDIGITENLRKIVVKEVTKKIAEDIYDWLFYNF